VEVHNDTLVVSLYKFEVRKSKNMIKWISILSLLCILSVKAPSTYAQDSNKYFTIKVVDQETGRAVPMVELKTNNKIS